MNKMFISCDDMFLIAKTERKGWGPDKMHTYREIQLKLEINVLDFSSMSLEKIIAQCKRLCPHCVRDIVALCSSCYYDFSLCINLYEKIHCNGPVKVLGSLQGGKELSKPHSQKQTDQENY